MLNLFQNILRIFFGRKTISRRTRAAVEKDWQEIEVLMKEGAPSQLKQALIMADRSLDSALKDLVSGQNMGERLKNAKDMFDFQLYDKIWQAHKLRNSLVHESGFEAPVLMVKPAIEVLKKAVTKLGINL